MTKLIILSLALIASLFIIKNPLPPNNEAVEQLQRLNESLERLRGPMGLDMRFPARTDQKFSA